MLETPEIKEVSVVEDIYAENDRIAGETKKLMEEKEVFVINVMGSPGAGKTSSIIQLIHRLTQLKIYVVEGDIESDLDTRTMKKLGIEAVQINTGGACHLDAPVVQKALGELNPAGKSLIFIENVGNLVCPAEFEIGEHVKMLVCSAAEGSDKPYKYPLAFEKAQVILLNKSDLKPYVDFDEKFFNKGIRALNKTAPIFEVNGKTGEGFEAAAQWIESEIK